MIGLLRGTIALKTVDHVVLDVGGVGYEVTAPLRDLQRMPAMGEEATLHIHTHVREDAIVLFGFVHPGDRKIFQRLLSVSGIGPKLGIAALSVMSGSELQSAIMAGDVSALSRISGVGKKTAQRIALELGERIGAIDLGQAADASLGTSARETMSDLRAALESLGFGKKQVDGVVDGLRDRAEEGASTEDLIKEALALLR